MSEKQPARCGWCMTNDCAHHKAGGKDPDWTCHCPEQHEESKA